MGGEESFVGVYLVESVVFIAICDLLSAKIMVRWFGLVWTRLGLA